MNRKKIIIIAMTVVILGAFSFWAFPIVKNRYFSNITSEDKATEEELDDTNARDLEAGEELPSGDEVVSVNEDIEEEMPDDELEETDEFEDDAFLEIFSSDCDNDCSEFTEPEDIKYCKEYCGLTLAKNETDCSSLEDLDRDYCIKQEAVKKKDIKLCEDIEDSGIAKSCRNRVAEDIVDMKTPE